MDERHDCCIRQARQVLGWVVGKFDGGANRKRKQRDAVEKVDERQTEETDVGAVVAHALFQKHPDVDDVRDQACDAERHHREIDDRI